MSNKKTTRFGLGIDKKIKSYTCPHCKKKPTTVILWQTASIGDEYDLETGNYAGNEPEIIAGEFESWACGSCGEELPIEMNEKLRAILN